MKLHDALTGAALAIFGAVVLWHVQGFPLIPGQKYGAALFPRLFPPLLMEDFDHLENRPVDHVIGAFYLVRRELFKRAALEEGVFAECLQKYCAGMEDPATLALLK